MKNPDIKLLIETEEIAGWGRVFEFIYAGFSFNAGGQKTTIVPVDSSGSCPLTVAIEDATANDICGAGTTAKVKTWTKWFKRIFSKNDDDWPVERKHAYITTLLKYLCANNASSELSETILNANIPGFGTVQDYLTFGDLVKKKL
jgi:hypothetical protein